MSTSDRPKQSWHNAITIGIVTSIVVGTILGLLVRWICPEANDDPFTSNLIGICICGIAVGIGGLEAHKYRPKR